MDKKSYKTTVESLDELHDALSELGRVAYKEAGRDSKRLLGVLTKAGIDGKLTGADVVISIAGLGLGLAASMLFFLAKLADGYRLRDAIGCGVDIMMIVLAVVVLRFLLDVLSIPLLLSSIFELKSILPDSPVPPQVVRNPIFINRPFTEKEVLIGLPNGETIGKALLVQFLEAVKGGSGKLWSREEWCNSPADPKRPGRGLMSQEQWRGTKALLTEMGLWRSKDEGALERFAEDLKR